VTTKPKGELPNVQIIKLSNQNLPHGSDVTSLVMNIFVKHVSQEKGFALHF
jgi:hypothetical protein